MRTDQKKGQFIVVKNISKEKVIFDNKPLIEVVKKLIDNNGKCSEEIFSVTIKSLAKQKSLLFDFLTALQEGLFNGREIQKHYRKTS